ncbi:MAG: methylmalonyl Co-A mutase-associated GTPase MeaB [Burkholderiales bacterium]|nr:methylmalonyl Co-A mutase-associated GTPase MeaB [Burkholderiales bacterium]
MSGVAPLLDRRALGLALTRIANIGSADALAAAGDPPLRQARRIGLTGAPGAGKSTLAGRLALSRLDRGRLGVLAIDPTSPKTGGAILGDRIRMDDLAGSENLFIRSFGSRSASDGLTDNLHELLETMDRFGFDEVIVETVGVGQAEVAARTQVDTLILVIPPDAGDVVQAMKAGIMEIADIFAINKADMPSAAKMAIEVKRIIALTHRGHSGDGGGGWVPPVVLTSQADPDSIVQLSVQVDCHAEWLRTSGEQAARALARRRYWLRRWLERNAQQIIDREPAAFFERPRAQQMATLLRQLGRLPGGGLE